MMELAPAVRKLIALYARNLAVEAENTDEFRMLDATNGSMTGFNRARSVLRKYRSTLESLKVSSTQKQAIACLHTIRAEADPENRAVVYQFALDALASTWRAEQKDKFERIASALIDGYDYFLSFTGRNVTQGARLRVNREYEAFINIVVDKTRLERANWTEENLLAFAIDALLRERSLKGFYYPERRGDSAQVLAKLEDGVNRAISMVQLLDNVMFMATQAGDQNWSYWEFKRALYCELSLLFLFPYANRSELLAESDRLQELDDWYQRVCGADLRILPLAPLYDRSNLAKINDEITALSAQILSERTRMIESVPA